MKVQQRLQYFLIYYKCKRYVTLIIGLVTAFPLENKMATTISDIKVGCGVFEFILKTKTVT